MLLGPQEQIRVKEHPVEQDKRVGYLTSYLAYRKTPFQSILYIIDKLPSNARTELFKGEHSTETALDWAVVRDACLFSIEEVEHLMGAAMNEDAGGAVDALRAIKRHAETLARLKSGDEGTG
jgi:hypothetical protein